MNTINSLKTPSAPHCLRHALALAEEANRMERAGRHAESDRLTAAARRVCAQSVMRNVGEFAGWGMRGVANGVAAVGGAIGHGLYDLGTGIAGGWTGQFAPVGPATGVKQQDRPDTAHLPSAESKAWVQAQGTTMEQFIERCQNWVSRNHLDDLVPHLKANGVPSDVVKYVNRRLS